MSFKTDPNSASPADKKVKVAPAKPAARPGSPRIAQPVHPQQKGFSLRPLDLALIVLGVLGVAAIVIVILANSSSPTAGGSAGQTASNPGQSTAGPGGSGNPLTIGQIAPNFTLTATDGSMVSLSQFKGKVVLLEFMAPWCPHCQKDSVTLNQIYDQYSGKNVQMLGVSATPFGRNHENPGDDTPIKMDDMIWFRDNFHVKYPMLFDPTANVGKQGYGVQGFPTIYVLDANDVIVDEPDNPVSAQGISAALDKALK